MKTLSPKAALWIPTVFVAALCAMTMFASLNGIGKPLPGSLTVLVCFLPCVTMMIAQVTQRNVSQLEARIAELERQTNPTRV